MPELEVRTPEELLAHYEKESGERDNWRLWVFHQQTIQPTKFRPPVWAVAVELSRFVDTAGNVNVRGLAQALGLTPETTRKYLAIWRDLGVSFAEIHRWPHPTRSPG